MGVTKFNTIFVSHQANKKEEIKKTCAAFFLDANSQIFMVINIFIEGYCKAKKTNSEDDEKNMEYVFDLKDKNPVDVFKFECERVIDNMIKGLSEMKKLKEIYIAMDGTPCHGKIQQQMRRRKYSRKIYHNGKLFISDSMTIPGTIVTDIFSSVISERFEAFVLKNKSMSLVKSLCNVPGEGEHKILDMVRESSYANFSENSEKDTILIESIDSDTIISILHQQISYTYVKTTVHNQGNQEEKIVSISSIRDSIIKTQTEMDNFPLLLAFAGNDFLPEMLDSLEIKEMYERMSNLCQKNLTKVIKIDDIKSVRVIDFKNFGEFLGLMRNNELDIYFGKTKTDNSSSANPFFRNPHFSEKLPETNAEKTMFKKKYYQYVYEQYCSKVLRKSPEYEIIGKDETQFDLLKIISPDESPELSRVLAKFEKQMAVSYLKTYIYYYYYQSGYKVGKPLDNSFYPYGFPPLYNSLYRVFVEMDKNDLIQFSHEFNPELIPEKRESDYYNKLPQFIKLHHFMVLQNLELKSIYNDNIPFDDKKTEEDKKREIYHDQRFQTRLWHEAKKGSGKKGLKNYIELYPRIEIDRLLEKYQDLISTEIIVKSQVIGASGIKQTKKNTFQDKYSIQGNINFE